MAVEDGGTGLSSKEDAYYGMAVEEEEGRWLGSQRPRG
jgi:hypothetical protein